MPALRLHASWNCWDFAELGKFLGQLHTTSEESTVGDGFMTLMVIHATCDLCNKAVSQGSGHTREKLQEFMKPFESSNS